jgi:hypothetical protein
MTVKKTYSRRRYRRRLFLRIAYPFLGVSHLFLKIKRLFQGMCRSFLQLILR